MKGEPGAAAMVPAGWNGYAGRRDCPFFRCGSPSKMGTVPIFRPGAERAAAQSDDGRAFDGSTGVTRRRSLVLFACGALAADAGWLAFIWLGSAGEPPHVPHYVLPSSQRAVELALGCGATSLWAESGLSDVGPLILLEHDADGARISDCVRHRSGGTISPSLAAGR